MRHFFCLVLILAAGFPPLFSQVISDCNPDLFQAVDDTYFLDEDDLPLFTANLLSNDIIGLDYDGVSIEGLPPCFGKEQGTGYIFYSGGSADGSDCCGTFTFAYTIFAGDLICSATVRIIVECGTSKGDCTVIEMGPENNDGSINPDEPTTGDTPCVYVCENGITTVLAPYSDQNTYDWTITEGTLINTLQDPASVEVQWQGPGQGNISLTITGPGGTQILQQCVEIGAAPHAEFTAPSPVCLNTPVQFQSLSTPGASHFWDFGDGHYSNEVNPIHPFSTPGTQEVLLTVTTPLLDAEGDTVCCCQDTYALEVEVLDEEGPNIECITTLCEGDSACYWTTTTCANATYAWTVNDANGNSINFDGQGTPEICLQWDQGPFGEVSLIVSDCDGVCDQPTTVQVPIISSSSVISGPDIVCIGDVAVYSVPKWMDVVYDWNVSGGTVVSTNGNQVSVMWPNPGVGSIDVTYESPFLLGLKEHNAPDCSGEGNLTVEVLPELLFTQAPNAACVGSNLTFSTNATSINWSVSAPATGAVSGALFDVNFPSSGTYTVTASDPNSIYCNSDVSTTVIVVDPPNPIISGPTEGCAGEDLLYVIDPVEPGVNYYWNVGSGQGTVSNFSGTNTTVNWSSTATAHELSVSAYQTTTPFCFSETTQGFEPNIPVAPTGLVGTGTCENQIAGYSLTTSGTPDGEEFTWSISPITAGSVISGQGSTAVDIQWNSQNTPTASIKVTSSLCNEQEVNNFTVTVHPQPTPVISQTGHLCPGALIPAELSTAIIYNDFLWSPPSGPSGSGNFFQVNTSGEHSVTVTDGNDCQGTAYFTVEDSPVPTAVITSPNPNVLCIPYPDPVTLVTPTQSGWSHAWSDGTTGPSPGSSITTYTPTGSPGTVTYAVTTSIDATGCSTTSAPYHIQEENCTSSGTCNPEYGISLNANVNCNTATINNDLPAAHPYGITHHWGDGASSGGNSHTYTQAGCYNVVVNTSAPNLTPPPSACPIGSNVEVCVPVAADFSFDIINCDDVIFTDGSSYIATDPANTIVSWAWDFNNDGTVDYTGQNPPMHSYIGGGSYTASLTVTTFGGCSATATHNVDIGSVSAPNITIQDPACVGEPKDHSVFANGAVNYIWSFPDGSAFEGPEFSHSFTSVPTTNTVTVTAVDSQGCTETSSATITVYPEPSDPLAATLDEIVCADPGTADIQSDPAFASHEWTDASSTVVGTSALLAGVGAGEYSVTVTDGNGCSRTSGPITVQVLPDMSPAILGPSVLCGTDDASYSTIGGFYSYKWLVNGIELSTASTLNNVTGAPGQTSTIDLIVTDADGCTHSSSLSVEWVEDIQFNLTSPNSPPCAGTSVLIEVDPVDPDVDYNWNTGATGESFVAQNAGIYTATGINANGCFHSASFEILPPPDLCTVPSGCHEDCYAQVVCAPEGHAAYQWYQDGIPVPGAYQPCFVVNATGLFWVEVTGQNGCTSTSEILDFTLLDCSCDFEPIVEVDDECCVTLSFDNNSTGCFYELLVHTHGEPATFDPSSDFNLINSGPADIQLEYIGGIAPIGIIQDAVKICLIDPQPNVLHNIGWDWSNPAEDTTCGGEFPFDCGNDTTECPKFECTNNLYQVFGGSSQLGHFDPGNVTAGFVPEPSFSYDDGNTSSGDIDPINATGYNTLDHYAYGLTENGVGQIILIQIGDNGCSNPLNVVTLDPTHPNFNQGTLDFNSDNEFVSVPNQGDFEEATNLLYVRMPNAPRIHAIDVTSATVVASYDLNSGDASMSSVADFAYSIVDEVFYGVAHVDVAGANSNRMVRFDPWIGDASYVNPASPSPSFNCSGWGAAYSDLTGAIYATCNNSDGSGPGSLNTYNFNPYDGAALGAFQTGSGDLNNNDGFSCPLESIAEDSTCATILEDALICQEDGSLLYNFTLCNSANTPFDIGYFTLSAVGPPGVILDNTTFDLSGNSLAPGDCEDFSVLVQGADATDELCLFFSVHEENPAQNPAATCCFFDVCMEVPECGCAEVDLFDATCTTDGYVLQLGIVNHLLFDFGQIQMTYPGQYGPIVQWVTGVSLGAQMSSPLGVTLDPNALPESPFCIDMVFYQAGNAGEWLECCHIQTCIELPWCGGEVLGCMDPDAINYDPNATVDDGSCLYDQDCIGPNDPTFPCIEIYDPVCGCDGITYSNECFATMVHGVLNFTPGPCEGGGIIFGCMEPEACNYSPEATADSGSCAFAIDGYDCDGNCLNDADGDGICDEFAEEIPGCTNQDAVNYNPEATVDDGSCLWDTCVLPTLINPYYPCTEEYEPVCGCNGMTYANSCYAMYFGGLVSWTPGACDNSGGPSTSDACPTDINEDGTTNVTDLLMVLGECASECE